MQMYFYKPPPNGGTTKEGKVDHLGRLPTRGSKTYKIVIGGSTNTYTYTHRLGTHKMRERKKERQDEMKETQVPILGEIEKTQLAQGGLHRGHLGE